MKPILFVDFDGTLCFDKYWRSLPHEQYEKIQSLIFGADGKHLNDWMLGKYSAEEINQYIADEVGIPFSTLWSVFVDDCKTMKVSMKTLEKISSLRERYTTVLITGNMDSFTRFTVPSLQLDTHFDNIYNSFSEGKHKTDEGGAIFLAYADSLQVPIQKCILLDNSQKICAAFSQLGGTACLITAEQDTDFYLSQL